MEKFTPGKDLGAADAVLAARLIVALPCLAFIVL
jgi:hypothetical protein